MSDEQIRYREVIVERLADLDDTETGIRQAVLGSIPSNHWGCLNGEVYFGLANSLDEFATLLFHEIGHKLFGARATLEGEKFCHEFSRFMCERLGLPFSEDTVRWCLAVTQLANGNSSQEDFERVIGLAPPRVRELLQL